ncbi:MAG: hypothetical protein FWB98_03910 [Defluviitaleaceae bacterium]|nr:hypothetical protein [Defluviitaleaceae bacterium]
MSLGFEDALVANILSFRRLESEKPAKGHDMDSFLKYMQNRAQANAEIMDASNWAITQHLRPALNNLDEENADLLYALSQRLFTVNENLDMGLALEIHKGIIKWARDAGDTDRLVRSLYAAGIIYQQLNTFFREGHSYIFMEEGFSCFREGAAFKEQYFQIKSKETRGFINRCIGNKYVMVYQNRGSSLREREKFVKLFCTYFDEALEFWNDANVRNHDPDMPFDAFIANAHQNMCAWLSHLRSQVELGQTCKALAQRVYNSFLTLNGLNGVDFLGKFWPNLRTHYTGRCVAYVMGKITYDEMLNDLRGFFANADPADYSADGMYAMLYIPLTLIEHIGKTRKISNNNEVKDIMKKIIKYCEKLPNTADKSMFNLSVSKIARLMTEVMEYEDALDWILKFTTYTHLPTFVHSVMVRDLTNIISQYLLKQNPELFIGISNTKTVDDVISEQEEILSLISRAAFCHDVGKIFYIDKVALCSRQLYDFEFEIIKLHANADTLIKANNSRLKFISDVISGHHRWHDGTKGYSESFDNFNVDCKLVLDIVAVTDSIDAATDIVGRSYAKSLTLEQVVEEIHQQAGTRYSPIVSQALRDDALLGKLRRCITEGRKNAYFNTYQQITDK